MQCGAGKEKRFRICYDNENSKEMPSNFCERKPMEVRDCWVADCTYCKQNYLSGVSARDRPFGPL